MVEASASELGRAKKRASGTSKNGFVRVAIAERKNCPFGLMVTLVHDSSDDVRVAVAGNPRAQRSLFKCLAGDRAAQVAPALIFHFSLRQDIPDGLDSYQKSEGAPPPHLPSRTRTWLRLGVMSWRGPPVCPPTRISSRNASARKASSLQASLPSVGFGRLRRSPQGARNCVLTARYLCASFATCADHPPFTS